MKKQTKNILTKLMLATAPFAVAATVASTNVMANADSNSVGNWDMTPAEQAKADKLANDAMRDNGTIGPKAEAEGAKKDAALKAAYDKSFAQIKKETAAYINKQNTAKKTPAKKAATKKVTKKHVAKKHVKKATKKHVAKKVAKKRIAKKHARRLFRIRVKAHRIYAYKTIAMHKAGRRAEVKGTKLYVYGTAKRHGRTYYKVYGHRWITSAHKYVARV